MERVTDGVETASFKSLFLEWNSATDFSLKFNKNAVKKEDEAIDVQKLMAVCSLEQTAVDDGSGELVLIFNLQANAGCSEESGREGYQRCCLKLLFHSSVLFLHFIPLSINHIY